MKILSVDDNQSAGLVIEGILRSLGHEVVLVQNAADALTIQQAQGIRVVVSDWRMQGMDGLELCRSIRQSNQDYVYFILCTQSEHSEANEQMAIEAGVDDFLTKPVRVHEMRSRIHVAQRILRYTHQVKQLEKFLPICAYCKKIRDDHNYWEQLESYISRHTDSEFSHGVCPDCYQTHIIPQLHECSNPPQLQSKPPVKRTEN